MGMLDKVRETIKRGGLSRGERLLVAVSGGADSMALLYALYRLRGDYDLQLFIAHLDHGIRQDTAEDLRVVRDAAAELGLSLIYERRDAPAFARRAKKNLEEAARIVRRDFFLDAAQRVDAEEIALGHTRTDLAETVLLHLLRGAGPGGLRGILALDPPYIRPLINVSREETRRFCREHSIPFHDDPTNQDTRFLRNAVRLELLPQLSRYNPRVEEALSRAAELWAEAEEALEWAAARALAEIRDGEVLCLGRLGALPKGVQALVVRTAAAEALGGPQGLTRKHVEGILGLLSRTEAGETVLPGGLRARVEGGHLSFGPKAPAVPFERDLPLMGEASFPDLGWRFRLSRIPRPLDLQPPSPFVAHVDPAGLAPPLLIRTRRPGDRLRPLGMIGEKKVKELLMEAKIAASERGSWPLVCDQRGIVWVVGVRISEEHKVPDGAREVLRIEAEKVR
jgi:tRNA(Ile)-lysidine synthase